MQECLAFPTLYLLRRTRPDTVCTGGCRYSGEEVVDKTVQEANKLPDLADLRRHFVAYCDKAQINISVHE